ncbi:MAG: hypothetical protein ACD_46C00237G0001 [uncultured bacterium]|nr:MAG: hypothetical protein ACD_46C00237G0001 [uncultured bacterium]
MEENNDLLQSEDILLIVEEEIESIEMLCHSLSCG